MMPVSKYRKIKLSIAISIAMLSAGCAVSSATQNDAEVDKQTTAMNDIAKPAPATVHDTPAPLEISKLPDAQQEERERAWLHNKAFSYQPKNAVSANVVLKMFREKGVNITSTLPLDNYFYNGNGVNGADGETAIRLILGQMGLDYEINDRDHYVNVVPMKSHTWTINLGNRKSHSTATNFDNVCNITSAQTSQNVTTDSGNTGNGNGNGNSQNNSQNQSKNSTDSGDSSVETKNDFWTSLKAEFTERVKVLVPTNSGSTQPQSQQAAPAYPVPGINGQKMAQNRSVTGANSMYTPVVMGQFSMNPETGTVTVQAPRWMLKQIDAYMEDILAMFNTSMTFEGKVVNVRSSSDRTTGFDLSALGRFVGKYGVIISNNILGGVSLSGSGASSISYGGGTTLPSGGSTLGIVSDSDNLRIFNAFLKTIDGTQTVSEPLLTVTSGVPADFGRLTPYYTNELSQDLSAGNVNTNALVTTKNNIIEHRYGSLLRIMPHYDPKTRRVRAQISLLQKPLVGFQTIPTYFTNAKGGIQTQNIRKPQIECSVTSTEAILDDGELIVIGGQVDNSTDTSHSGTDGLMDVKVLDWFTSSKSETSSKTTSYFAIRVRLNKKQQMATQEW